MQKESAFEKAASVKGWGTLSLKVPQITIFFAVYFIHVKAVRLFCISGQVLKRRFQVPWKAQGLWLHIKIFSDSGKQRHRSELWYPLSAGRNFMVPDFFKKFAVFLRCLGVLPYERRKVFDEQAFKVIFGI